jgi:TPR repeat protein
MTDARKELEDGKAAFNRSDYNTALRLLLPLAESGDPASQRVVGEIYLRGWGVEPDGAEAAKWWIRAVSTWRELADQGNAEAQFDLGSMFLRGYGLPEDDTEAFNWFHKAAQQGYAPAQYLLGEMCGFGKNNIWRPYFNPLEALKWNRKAADQGFSKAQYKLGLLYSYGTLGLKEDKREAIKWLRKAAEQGHADAQNNLGAMYADGSGVQQDYKEAYAWLSVAAAQGANKAAKSRDLIATRLTPAALFIAQQLSKRYFAEYVKTSSATSS